MCKSRATCRAIITCNTSRAIWYEGAVQPLSLTGFKSHLFSLFFLLAEPLSDGGGEETEHCQCLTLAPSRLDISVFLFLVQLHYQSLILSLSSLAIRDRLVGLVVRRPPRERKIPGSNLVCAWIFSGSSHTSDSKIDTPVATLPGAWRYRVSAGTGRPGVRIL